MAQQENPGALPLDAMLRRAMPAGTPDDVSIFSAPGLEVVFQWWQESNRRWTEQNGSKALTVATVRHNEPA